MKSNVDIDLVKRALSYLYPYKLRFITALACISLGVVFNLIHPYLWGKILSSLFIKDIDLVMINIGYLLITYIFQELTNFLQYYLFSFLSGNIVHDIKKDMYQKLLDLPIKAFDEKKMGEFVSRMHSDVASVANMITQQFLNTLMDIIKIVVVGIAVFSINIPMALAIVCVFPVSYFIFVKYGKEIRKRNTEIVKVNDNYFNIINESIIGIREINCLGIKESLFQKFLRLGEDYKKKNLSISILNTVSHSLSQAAAFLSQVITIALGGYFILKGSLQIEYYIAFSAYSAQFSNSLLNITKLNSNIQQILTSLERIFGLMNNLDYSLDNQGREYVTDCKGAISFRNVTFGYKEEKAVLNNITFDIPPKRKVAIVGQSGSGKTTIFNLILRLYNINSGNILLDNMDIRELEEASIRDHISVVRQDPFLFNTTIRENFELAAPSASEEDIYNACKAACIHEHILSLSGGYNTIIGSNGLKLSGGEKQRIAIARALLRKSKIILFDEATSSLDNESQYYIKKAINEISRDHTIVIIAHRLSTIIEADEIIVLNEGKIAGRGDHESLINKNPIYKRLYEIELKIVNKV